MSIYVVIIGDEQLFLPSSAFRRIMDHFGKSRRRAFVNQ